MHAGAVLPHQTALVHASVSHCSLARTLSMNKEWHVTDRSFVGRPVCGARRLTQPMSFPEPGQGLPQLQRDCGQMPASGGTQLAPPKGVCWVPTSDSENGVQSFGCCISWWPPMPLQYVAGQQAFASIATGSAQRPAYVSISCCAGMLTRHVQG